MVQKLIKQAYTGVVAMLCAVLVPLTAFADERTKREKIPLLEPIDSGKSSISISPGLGTWFEYFNAALPWLYDIAVGLCIIWLLYGGYMIMISSDQADKRATGKAKMIGAIIGIGVLSFAGTILRMLNDMFFD